MPQVKTFKSFADFTNLYEVQKTLRFELKPVGKTADLIKQNNVLQTDKQIDDNYHSIKYYFDLLHKKFIKESLSDVKLDYKDYENVLFIADKKDLKKEEENLRKLLVKRFNKKANDWKDRYNKELKGQAAKEGIKKPIQLKSEGIDILFEKDNFEILKIEFSEKPKDDSKAPDIRYIDKKDGQPKNLFESFKGFTTYLTNFNHSRKNFYSEKDQDTAVANRAINENLAIFCSNRKLFESDKKYQDIDFNKEEKVVFDISFYNNCLIQDGIKKYNEIIGRKSQKENEGEKGLNQKINEYNQKNKDNKLQLFKKLYNQILADQERFSREVEITSDEQVFSCLKDFIELNDRRNNKAKALLEKFFSARSSYDFEKIYIKKSGLNTLLGKFFGQNAEYVKKSLPHRITSSKEEKYQLDDFVSIQTIKDALLGIQKDKKQLSNKYQYLNKIEMSPKDLFKGEYKDRLADDNYQSFLNIWKSEFEQCLKECELAKKRTEEMIIGEEIYNKKNEAQIEKIKNYADASLAAYQMVKYFALEKGRKKVETLLTDNDFYNGFNDYYQDYPINSYYNEFRNYVTKKDFLGRLLFPVFDGQDSRDYKNSLSKRKIDGAEKIKLNFDISHDQKWNFFVFLFRHNSEYYVGVCKKDSNKIKFSDSASNGSQWEAMKYKQLKFKTLAGKSYVRDFKAKYSEQEDKVAIKNLKSLIQGKFLRKYPLLGEILNKTYLSKVDLYKDIVPLLDASYANDFVFIEEDIEKINNDGDIYLFKINNKDFRTVGKPNLHTSYFNLLFDQPKPFVLKLNAEVALFFRPKVENLPNYQKDDKDVKWGKNKEKNVLQHRRYAEDKYFLHLSTVQNFGKEKISNSQGALAGHRKRFNLVCNEKIANKQEIKIIGIDRGEKNLAYYSVIDSKGNTKESGSFNEIDVLGKDGNVIKTDDYLQKLKDKAGSRDEARKNWKTIENIKELKNGYVSQVVRKICDLILKYDAIVVFEDLNFGFKLKRSALDFPVYQKLEMALIRKLNYLVNKGAKEKEAGHCLKAYQLAPMVANPKDIGKQTGIVFYTQASYTSKTCPKCGFRKNNNKFKYFESIRKAQDWLGKLEKFEYDEKIKKFKVRYNLNDFLSEDEKNKSKKKRENELFLNIPRNKEFTIYSDVIRYKWHNKLTAKAKELNMGETKYLEGGKGVVKKYDITECLKGLFDKNKINYKENLKDCLVAENNNLSTDFYRNLFYYLNLIFEIRNSVSGEDIDYIQCPACGFNSDKPPKELEKVKDADANGAYNIARKGLMILEKIKQFKDLSKLKNDHLFISLEEWDKFTQKDWQEK